MRPLRVKIVTWGRAASVEGLRRAGGHVVRRFPKK
jgi:hypothetical protein